MSKNKNSDPAKIIFQHVDKPKNFAMSKAINVFDDKYRINIYIEKEVSEGLCGKRMSSSYFVRFNTENNKMDILMSGVSPYL